MKDLALVSPSRIERVLELACAYNTPLSVEFDAGKETYRYKSRMLEIKKTQSSSSLVIDLPASQGPAKTLRPETQISLFFAVEQGRYAFDSVVLRKTEFDLGNRKKISALEISYPNVLKSGQRRAYFRVPIPLRSPVLVDCTVIGDITEQEPEGKSAEKALPRPWLRGHTINISVGGMLIEFENDDIGLAEVGVKLALEFSLSRSETPLKLNAIIRRVEKKSATGRLRAGVEFVDTEAAFECRLAVNRLYRYVAERQRELIRSGSK